MPVGKYARGALTKHGVWSAVEDSLVRSDSVRSTLAFVDRGEVAPGIVYETDALIERREVPEGLSKTRREAGCRPVHRSRDVAGKLG